MTIPRSNARALSNVNDRPSPDCDPSGDTHYAAHLRTRGALSAVFPMVFNAVGVDWQFARAALTPFQQTLIKEHHACPDCNRWDRWPVRGATGWELSRTPFGCLCHRIRASGELATSVDGPIEVIVHAPSPEPTEQAPLPALKATKRAKPDDRRGGLW